MRGGQNVNEVAVSMKKQRGGIDESQKKHFACCQAAYEVKMTAEQHQPAAKNVHL